MPAVEFRGVENAAEKMKKLKEEYITNGMGVTMDVALDLEESQENNKHVPELQDAMLQYAEMERELTQWLQALDKTKTQFKKDYNPDSNEIPNLEKIFKEQLTALEAKNTDDALHSHLKVKEFVQKVWNVHHNGQPLPTQHQGDHEDEDLIMSQAQESTKCPITQMEMVKPMKSKKCGHNYDEQAILVHIKRGKGRAKCPVGGCPHNVAKENLEANTVLEHTIKRKNRNKK